MTKEGLSFVDYAEIILKEVKEPLDFYALYDAICERKEVPAEQKDDFITQFYADMTVSAKFVYTGENMWDVKENQKIELWEKDGSFYKEYTKVEIPEEYLEKEVKVVKPATPVAPVVEEPVFEEPVLEEETKEEVVEPTVEPAVEPAVAKPKITDEVTQSEEEVEYLNDGFDEELFEDFDEDKYNEYMDNYEDQYED